MLRGHLSGVRRAYASPPRRRPPGSKPLHPSLGSASSVQAIEVSFPEVRLASAVGAEETERRAAPELEIDPVNCGEVPEPLRQAPGG
jgi:hypothetical protein